MNIQVDTVFEAQQSAIVAPKAIARVNTRPLRSTGFGLYRAKGKRALDILFVLMVAGPVLLVTAVLSLLVMTDGKSPFYSQSQLVAWVRIWAQSPLSPSDYATRLKAGRPRWVIRLRDFVAILVSLSWRLNCRDFNPAPMTAL